MVYYVITEYFSVTSVPTFLAVENNNIKLMKVKGIGTHRADSFFYNILKFKTFYKMEL